MAGWPLLVILYKSPYRWVVTIEVIPTSEARTALPSVLSGFRRDGVAAEPMIFGSHRKPEGVVLPYAMFERLLPAIEEILLTETVRARLASPGESSDFDEFVTETGLSLDDIES